ncbi:MAG: class I SAM-dependent methyltransferase, partial [Nitrososphaera sp.]|nr:class I SAM-dependent methyltransferase [Nitrososphaera sp.]
MMMRFAFHNQIKAVIQSAIAPRVPDHLAKMFKRVSEAGLDQIRLSLKEHYFSEPQNRFGAPIEEYLASEQGESDLQDHLSRRLEDDRRIIIPWLDNAKPLRGASILEIGCGTGCSTVALAEQGADVTGIDTNNNNLEVAKNRCRVYGLDAEFLNANAAELHKLISSHRFDFIIFFATLEHMTHSERMIAMKKTWEMLAQGGLWCTVECPNRLWYFDSHTSMLPFYLWLPDDLAFKYSQFSPREGFNTSYNVSNEETMLDFLRRGRGVSFHEFDLALKKAETLKVVSSLELFIRHQSLLRKIKWKLSIEHRYASVLSKVGPKIHQGFYQPFLNCTVLLTPTYPGIRFSATWTLRKVLSDGPSQA